ncbi:unnamed protein product [Ceutorhynchus assimilis]|uniref:Regulatory protein zeste n=1 Tax=Ceutorhynchus assimilis TaxID=467358 RepID=A0A9P0DUX8_9CUCU|nr:unnamed protein product [Ceutorhynchus assimilis]CAG9762005.1 unnamed protein product [Ceutorhynchus assimilis]CAG9763396.1 unnamed protein product [Ceutorhynchus assimilis]CAG9764793.1 unnamed protein product [Ceutorhynchus assimilis]CAG9773436.1 unnamed protein product [Ceutorhynchus assimilis]
MMEKKRTSKKQFGLYIKFVKENPVLITGKLQPSGNPKDLEVLWDELSKVLNSCGDGPIRETASWKKVFTEWKSASRKKARENKQLSELEEEILTITGRGAVSGLDVRELGTETTETEDKLPKKEKIQSGPSKVKCLDNIVGHSSDEAKDEASSSNSEPKNVHKENIPKTKPKKKRTGDVLCDTYEAATNETCEKLEGISLAILEVAKAINRYCDIVEASNQTIEYVDEQNAEEVEDEDNY